MLWPTQLTLRCWSFPHLQSQLEESLRFHSTNLNFEDNCFNIAEKIMTSTLTFINVADFYVGKILYFCGYGQTKNRPDPDERPPQKFLCTELLVVPSENCSANANIICTRWPQKDNNVCPGDFGGPLYLREGALADVVGLAAWAPPNGANIAQCTDGHYTEHTQLGAYVSWIFDTIAAN